MAADTTKIAIYTKDSGGDVTTNSYTGINPVLGENAIRTFVSAATALIDGNMEKFVRTDQTTYFPVTNDGE